MNYPLIIMKGGWKKLSMDLENAYDKIYRYVYFKVKNQTVAEDITQETFLHFISQKGSIDRVNIDIFGRCY